MIDLPVVDGVNNSMAAVHSEGMQPESQSLKSSSDRQRPTGVRVIAAVALLLAAACGTTTPSPEPATASDGIGKWSELPSPPVSARLGAVTAWTGQEALFLGGDTSIPCPPNAACAGPLPDVRDGAAFNPQQGTWRTTAPAPGPIEPYGSPAVIGDEVYVMTTGGLQSYDASEDAWTLHHAPTALPDYSQLVADHGRVIVIRGEKSRDDPADAVYDPARKTWSSLPVDPLGPAFDRTLTSTSHGLVLTGHDKVPQPGVQPSFVRAALLPPGSERWQLLPDSDQIGGWGWTWTGERMVDPTLGGADGGEVNGYGRTIPNGGVLEPVSGNWGRLPNPPAGLTRGWVVEATTGPLAAVDGLLYDDQDHTWTKLPRPEGAPHQPGSAVWAGDHLIVVGGLHDEDGYTADALSNDAWAYQPSP